jgi:hypothetical protein
MPAFFASRTVVTARTLAAAALLGACRSGEKPAADTAAADAATTMVPAPAVSITSPADGDSVSLPFTVSLAIAGAEVVPADGMAVEGKGHHHLIVGGDATYGDSIPLPPAPTVIHMGNGATDRVIDSLSPGPHRIVAIFAYGTHVPMANVKRDTITVVVK